MCDVPTVTFDQEVVLSWACTKSLLSYAKLDMGDRIFVFTVKVNCWLIILYEHICQIHTFMEYGVS